MNQKLTLLSVMVAAAFAHAEGDNAQQEPQQGQLQQVEVKADAKRVHAARSYSIASDGDMRDRVNLGVLGKANAFTAPITVVSYDEQALNNTEARTLVDAVAKKDASTWQFGGESNTLTGLYFRGYQLDARQFSVNGLAGMYGTQGTASVQVGSAQLIKGASTAVNGMDPEGAVSGAVNIETKKAADEGNRKIGLGWFSNNRAQGTFDLGQRFGENKEFGVRANGKLRHGDTPRHGYSEDNKEFALNADYRGEKLRVAFDSIYAKRKTNGGRARMQDIQNLQARLFDAPDGKTNLLPSWNWQNTVGQTNMLTFEWDAFERAQITGGIGYNKARYYGTLISPTVCLNATSTCTETSNTNAAGRTTARNYDYNTGTARLTDQYFRTLSMNLSARGEFETGPVSHNWSTAFDRIIRQRATLRGSAAGSSSARIDTSGDIASQLASFLPDYPTTMESSANLDANIKVNSLALSDTLGFADNKYRLTLGGRYQYVEYTDKKAGESGNSKRFSPMAMMAWVPSPDLVVYGNYMEDLEPADIKTDDDGNTTMAKPRVSRQFEIGVRKNWGDFVTTLNAFQIRRPGYWRGNTTSGTDFARSSAAAGDEQGIERNRGIEFNAYANLLDKTLRPNVGIMYLQSKLKAYPNAADNLINGVQVANPRVIAKAGVEWDMPFAKGLTLNSNVQYFGKSYQDTQKKYAFPSYTLVDAGARYKTKLGQKNTLTVSGAVENLFNRKYWQVQRGQYDRSFAVVGMPRTYWLKAELEF
ncbi:MAG: TonB-dependent receptor [Neisseria sp.]|nr:TonB-dependent receptor [Neisseria sp.]